MIGKWIIEGQLNDPFHEFFIVGRDDIALKEMWRRKYVLVRKHIPIFISRALAKQIHSIGRNLNFIRTCCRDNFYEPQLASYFDNLRAQVDLQQMSEFEGNVRKLAECTNQR